MLEGADVTKIAFKDQRKNEVEKTDQKDLLVNLNKPALISCIEFVIPNKFKDVENKNFYFYCS